MKKIKAMAGRIIIVLLSSVILFQTASATQTDERMADEILVYVNQYRAQHGLSKLIMNNAISEEAAKHSRDMAMHALPFGHDGFSKRIRYLHEHVVDSSSGAENVAYNYKTARIVVDGWIKSPGHRQNIMGHYNLTGIGIARDKTGKIYYTQLFLRADHDVAARPSSPLHRHSAVIVSGTHTHGHHAYS